ncbi:hypothetical protein RN629_06360 [Sphingomonadaceae bacterium jetA1]|jgi:hypothetical protein|uniref:hypothetical protein n=1 Tax=Facivitalis istanbulensis TaxID=3075838 RepID=UPI003470607A
MGANDSHGTGESAADIRSQLWARIAALDVAVPYAAPADLAREVEVIRRIAHAHGLSPAVTVTHFIDRALARAETMGGKEIGGGTMPPVHGWLAMLHDAVASERQDYDAADRFATACSMRLAH